MKPKKKSCKMLNEMIREEKKSPSEYGKLKKRLPVNERKKITRIQKQERQHAKTLEGIKKRMKK